MPDDVFINGRAVVYQGSQGQSIAFPDVCLCPPTPPAGPVPTPLPNTVKAPDLEGGAASVLTGGKPTGKRSSYFAKSTGNEVAQSTGGGVVSHTVQGKAYFQSFSPNVFIEGEPAVRHLDMLTQNHLAQPGNTPPAVWMSAMAPPAAGDPGPANLVTKPEKKEGQATIRVAVVDELGHRVQTRFQIKTPKGQTVADHLLWGGSVWLSNLDKGNCKLVLPDIDDQCRRLKHDHPAQPHGQEIAYRPASPLDVATGKGHTVVVPAFRTLWIEIPRIPDDEELAGNQRFVLKSNDGRYEITRTVAADHVDDPTIFTLSFPDIFKGPKYTLTHTDGQRKAADVFVNQPFEALFPAEPVGDDDLLIHTRATRHHGGDDGQP